MAKSDLILKRNRDIVEKFNDLYNNKRLRMDDVLKNLSSQFYLKEDTIYSIVFYDKSNKQYYETLIK